MKGPEAFRTISEAADELGVPQHVLRFWETKFSFIRPMKRAGGRRFYRRQDIEVLRGLRVLLHDQGYTIKGVQRLHKEHGVRCVVEAVDPSPLTGPGRSGDPHDSNTGTPPARRPRPRKPAAAGQGEVAPALPAARAAPEGLLDASAAVRPLFEPPRRGPGPDRRDAPGPDAERRAEPAAPAPPPKTILGPRARRRLGDVLQDLEATKARLDTLLRL